MARETIRSAYYAAVAATPLRAAPVSFARHRIEFVVDRDALSGGDLEVDGQSLGLSAALAFASAWLDKPIASNTACLGTVTPWGQLGSVHAVEEKVRALAAAAGSSAPRVIGVEATSGEVLEAGGQAVSAAMFAEAAEEADLILSELGSASYGSVHDRLRALADLVSDIKTDNLARHGQSATWGGLADDLRRLIDSLKEEPAASAALEEARCLAGLAYSHAGLLEDVKAMLGKVERPESLGLEVRSLYDIVAVGRYLDMLTLETDKGRGAIAALEADLEELCLAPRSSMFGRAAGTLGRARMHLGQLDDTLPLLEEGVEHHLAHEPHEAARSRQYLAMALRMSGDTPEALDELFRARRELETLTRNYSPEYEDSCRVYLDYELARTLLAADRPADALAFANAAMDKASPGWWPRLGILRARAWALRMCNDEMAADEDVQAMQALAETADDDYRPLADRLVE